jgi:biotin-(acetyl-CoA carboxylase) ligase
VKDNIIDFTKAFEKRKKREKEIDELIAQSDREVADLFGMVNARETVWALRGMGINVEDDPRAMLDILTIIEASKALVFRSIGEDYAFQKFSNTVFEQVEEEAGVSIQEMLDKFIREMEDYFEQIDE